MRIHERRSLWRRMRPYFTVFDGPLTIIILMLLTVSLITLYSASIGIPGKMEDQVRNIFLAFVVMWVVANISPQMMMRIAVPAYVFGVFLLVCVALFGTIKLGARRWLHIGVADIQPSEFMKIVMPLMLAWFFQSRAGHLTWKSYAFAALLLAVPVGLIVRQPDLGTALLVVAAGFCVIFLAGLAWKALIGLFLAAAAALPIIWDADFLYGPRTAAGEDTYVLGEINVSSVMPIPDQAPAAIDRGCVDHGKPGHPAALGVGTEPGGCESADQPRRDADQRQNDDERDDEGDRTTVHTCPR